MTKLTERTIRARLRQCHGIAAKGSAGIVEVLADFEPFYTSVALGQIGDAAAHLENAARQLRDLVAVVGVQQEETDDQ
ncbi:MAG: hypothetical protein ABGX47_23910 [Martelella sp.]|uniref:hypothetical protein n=1 Tax=Martelella sp. TaxID=1969699 RepID=UPI003242F3EA